MVQGKPIYSYLIFLVKTGFYRALLPFIVNCVLSRSKTDWGGLMNHRTTAYSVFFLSPLYKSDISFFEITQTDTSTSLIVLGIEALRLVSFSFSFFDFHWVNPRLRNQDFFNSYYKEAIYYFENITILFFIFQPIRMNFLVSSIKFRFIASYKSKILLRYLPQRKVFFPEITSWSLTNDEFVL